MPANTPARRSTPTRKPKSRRPIDLVTAPVEPEAAQVAPAPAQRPRRAAKKTEARREEATDTAAEARTAATPAQRNAKAKFSAKPRLVVLGMDPDSLGRLRARYRRQLAQPGAALSFNAFAKSWIDGHLDADDARLGRLEPDHRALRP